MDLPNNYPYGCSDRVISRSLRKYADEIITANAQTNKVLQLAPLIMIGHTELQNRQTKRVTLISVGLGVLSLVIAIAALWISVAGNAASDRRQTNELQLLNALQEKLEAAANLEGQQVDILKSIDGKIQPQNSKVTAEETDPNRPARKKE